MDRSIGCGLLPMHGTAPGMSAPRLAAAWREAAERGRPACVLTTQEGELVVAWVNRTLSRLMGRDATDLTGRYLQDLVEPGGAVGSEGVVGPGGVVGSGDRGGIGTYDAEEQDLVDWAWLTGHLARSGGGSGPGALSGIDGSLHRVHLTVTAVDVPPAPPAVIPVQGRHLRPSSPDDDRPAAAEAAEREAVRYGRERSGHHGSGVVPVGVVGELASSDLLRSWLVEIEPVDDALADVEMALAVAENRFSALAGCAPVGIFASDAGMRLGYVNDRFVQLTGTPASALLGNAWLDLVHTEDRSSVYTAVQAVLEGTAVELTVRLAVERGVPGWLHLRLAPTTTPGRAAGFIGTAEDVTDRRLWEEHLTYQAQHDPLTGLVNRRRLIEVLSDLLSDHRGTDRRFAVLFLDLDGFKEINDTLGHEAGDRALVEVARRLQRVSRETDVLARIAGDEFVVVLHHIQSEIEAEAAARRHLAVLDTAIRLGLDEVVLTASVGVAMPTADDTPESLLREADRVMYEAKAAGHGLYRLAASGSRGNAR
ncbi:MAG: sensor diguanylate cyclase [Actinomycetota bacterium]|nr:sensor diguanylate cyclase [Actinomycetota bacterium]